MRKIIVFQHVAHKILGTLNPTLKDHKLNIRYVNFERTPEERPKLQKYNALIVLGGNMGVYEADVYRHIKVEMQLIEEALKKEIPILGICLGAQMIAQVLGSQVRKHSVKEIGWHDIQLTPQGLTDPLFSHFQSQEKLFQFHGDTFDIPKCAIHLACSEKCHSQAFRFGDKVYGLQFHLEVDEPMIQRWLKNERHCSDIQTALGAEQLQFIQNETTLYIQRSLEISRETFNQFIKKMNLKERPLLLGSKDKNGYK